MSTWEERMAARHADAGTPRAAGPELPAPDDGTCRSCYQWRRYPPPQQHFGWAWWRTCPPECGCAHHADEVWLA